MNEEEKKAIEDTKRKIKNTQKGLDEGKYYGERYNLEQEIKREEILLNLIDRLQIELNNSISKDKIYDLKERILLLLDDNRVPSPYLAGIREYFEDLLKENK